MNGIMITISYSKITNNDYGEKRLKNLSHLQTSLSHSQIPFICKQSFTYPTFIAQH